jgi:hypothetical protein
LSCCRRVWFGTDFGGIVVLIVLSSEDVDEGKVQMNKGMFDVLKSVVETAIDPYGS